MMQRGEKKKRARSDPIAAPEKRKPELLSSLAYDLRTPLGPLRIATEVLRLVCTDPLQNHALGIIDRQVSQLSRVVDELTKVTVLSRRVITLERRTVDMSVLADQALEQVRALIQARKQHLHVALPPSPVLLECDPSRLAQILEALLDNATRYTPEGGNVSLSIALSERIAITVSDDGQGIAAEQLPFIFNSFVRAESPTLEASETFGLGLSVIRNLVEIHGGTIQAESAGPGRGSTFTVSLPLILDTDARTEANTQPAKASPSGQRILVIDDQADFAESLAVWLRMRGYTVRTARDGRSGLAAAQEFHPDVVLLDGELPDIHGSVVAEELRRSPETSKTVLIAISGSADERTRDRMIKAGVDHYLVKPSESAHVLALIENSLSQK
jgi:CheY-like chemotaxis protein/two-component sensor histidine kinase